MKPRTIIVVLAGLLLTATAGLLWIVHSSQYPRARRLFDQIECGMTRTQVWEFMKDVPEEDSLKGPLWLNTWGIDGRYLMMVTFGPDHEVGPEAPNPGDDDDNNWTVNDVTLIDVSKQTPFLHYLDKIGLWSKSPPLHKSRE
jgi:hypothetical protein